MKKQTVLAILGSPNKDGCCATMLKESLCIAQEKGWDVEEISLYELHIGYCKGCRSCVKTGICVQQDDLFYIIEKLKTCDRLILAAPVYWANTPAIVKNMFDRLLGFAVDAQLHPRFLKGKEYIVLTSCRTPSYLAWIAGQSRGIYRNEKQFFRLAGMKCIGKYNLGSSDAFTGNNDKLRKKLRHFW